MNYRRKMLRKGYFGLARNISKQSDHRVKVGAVIANKKPVSVACNLDKTHPVYADPYKMITGAIHAEVRAVIHGENLEDSVVYVYRERKDGTPALARPCNRCYNVLKDAGVKKMYYTIDSPPYWKEEKIK